MQIEFIIHLRQNKSLVNQFAPAKRRERGNKTSGETTTEFFFYFLSTDYIGFSMPRGALNSSFFHQRTPGKANSFCFYLFFYIRSFRPLANFVPELNFNNSKIFLQGKSSMSIMNLKAIMANLKEKPGIFVAKYYSL